MTVADLQVALGDLGIRSIKAVFAAGSWLVICPVAVGSGSDLESAIANMVVLVKERRTRTRASFDDGLTTEH